MSDSAKQTAIASNYSDNIKKRFQQQGNKLFLVDYDKCAAIRTASELATSSNAKSVLVIVKNAAAAVEFAQQLSNLSKSFHIIKSKEQLQDALDKAAFSEADRDGASRRLKASFPHLIVVADDENGNSLLHHALYTGADKAYSFAGSNKKAPYCLSDALSQGAYDFLIVDSVFSLLAFHAQEEGQPLPAVDTHDHVDLLGNAYFSDTAHSYKRLKNIVTASSGALLLSDVIAKNDAVALYAVLDMISPAFSRQAAREAIVKICPDYAAYCERVCTDVSYCKDDDLVLGSCLQKAGSHGLHVSFDIDTLKEYFNLCLSYMSEEEIFLRVTDAYTHTVKRCFKSIDELMQSLTSDTEEMAACLCEMFFNNALKNELEGALSTPKLSQLTAQQSAAVITCFLGRGVYHCFPTDTACTVLRFKKDVSGFERYVRAKLPCAEDDADTFTLLRENNVWIYKLITLRRLLTEGSDPAGNLPLVLVCDTKRAQLRDAIAQIFPTAVVHDSIEAYCADQSTQIRILLADAEALRQTARAVVASTVVFFDLPHNIITQKLLLHKLRAHRGTALYLMAGYEHLEGVLLDSWQPLLLNAQASAPFENCELCLKEGSWQDYAEIVCTLDTLYHHLQTIITAPDKKLFDDFAATYNKALLDMTLEVTYTPEDIVQDMQYLADAGAYFEAIFANTVSTGDCGMTTECESYRFNENPENGKPATEQKEIKTLQMQLFEVCPKIVLGACDAHVRNCADCQNYKCFTINSTAALKQNLQKFFEKTKTFAEQLEQKRMQARAAATINSGDDEDNVGYLTCSKVASYQKQAMQAMETILHEKERFAAAFATAYETVNVLQHAATKAFGKVLGQYFTTVATIFKAATDKATASFAAGCDGFDSAYHGQ